MRFPKVFFGPTNKPKTDWRKHPDHSPDNDEKITTPHDVKKLLGFDPVDHDHTINWHKNI